MQPRTKLFVDSACLMLMSPFLGLMVAGIVAAVLQGIILRIAVLTGLLASLFYDVDLRSFPAKYERIDHILFIVLGTLGVLGGWIWGVLEIREKARDLKNNERMRNEQ